MPRLHDSEKHAKLKAFSDSFRGRLSILADNLYDGKITLGMWEEDFRTRLREYVVGAAYIGRGDTDTPLTAGEKGKIGAFLKEQYAWLHRFAADIYARRNTVTPEAIKARSNLYAGAGNVMATDMQAGGFAPTHGELTLPWLPGDGNSRCLNNCGCRWLLEVLEEDEIMRSKVVRAIWIVDPAKENCEDCLPRDGHEEIVVVSIDTPVPDFIGLGGEF